MQFQTIKELYEAVQSGQIDGSKLVIILDSDNTSFYDGSPQEDNENEITVAEANGYYDSEKLYPLLFPKARVAKA